MAGASMRLARHPTKETVMKLLRYGPRGQEKPALLDADGGVRDLSGVIDSIDARTLEPAGLAALARLDPRQLPLVPAPQRLGVPFEQPGKFLCVGLNYRDHAAEAGLAEPSEPILFFKADSALNGPNDAVVLPQGSLKGDWEVELGVVIGRTARYVGEAEALDYVAGYVLVNDVSEREYQLERGGTWDKGKGCDTFGPVGPWFVSADEIADPQALDLWLEVNGQRYQQGSTRNMIFSVAQLISYISRFMTLRPGDLIATGTPAGVGMGIKPVPRFLRAGDTMRVGASQLGEQAQRVYAWDAALLD
jgi:2-keto-4-pentenoate hydratase/2-oxohepta-3-ene-1,7-dioic acid hydratase in catechol pathway